MNDRQTELLRKLLVHSQDVFNVNDLARDLECSEKTLRNDMKVVEAWLQKESSAQLIRKPGIGVYISASDDERSHLFQQIHRTDSKSEKDRILELAYRMLVEEKTLTLAKVAEEYFTTIPAIKEDMESIKCWLEEYDLNLVSKQRLGSRIVGGELNKRNALAHLSELISSSESSRDYVLQLFPVYELDTVRQAIERMQREYDFYFNDGELESLLIHALVMIKRTRQHSAIQMKATDKRLAVETEEYHMASWFFEKIGRVLRLHFPEEEKIYFTWHLISCKRPDKPPSSSMNDVLNEVIEQLTMQLQIMTMMDFRGDRVLMNGLRVHLESAIHRVRYGFSIRNPMLSEIKKMYPYMLSMVVLALEEVNHKQNLKIPEDEAAYLVLHFQAAVERVEKKRDTSKRVLIVCELGVGMSHLLQAKLEQSYKGMEIVGCVGERNVAQMLEEHTTDFILSTKALNVSEVPTLVISPLLESKDKKQVDQFLKKLDQESSEPADAGQLTEFMQEELTFTGLNLTHRYKVIELLSQNLAEKGFVKETFGHRALLRERSSATSIGGGIAIPHAHPDEVNKSAVALAVLEEPIEWGSEKVSLVFLLAVAKEDQGLTRPLMKAVAKISSEPERVERLIDSHSFSEIQKELV
ncbi:BglG family transcription antiterminator [Halobacillus campisalis]|uniref:BglG family transcription antiterminator n=1 Tax=Halobacillus campisalis TaxID=435909 RepID=A0ABW2K6C4_9BACI|nr:BglG family transcription antiterminator [Halobacillus campisalis]